MPHPSGHLRPAGSPTPVDTDWDAWSKAWTRHIKVLTGRTDLTVVVAPGAGGGAPACFYPTERRIEVDATHIGDTPDITNPARAAHKKLVPTGYGLLVHEAAHAAHSHWTARTTPDTPPVVSAAAELLEESRAEGRQRGRRRADRRWLRHTVNTLITADEAPVDDPWHAGHLAGLLLARVDARIMTSKDVRTIRGAVLTVLGTKRLKRLREIWKTAHTVADDDATTMIDLGWQWCQALGIDPQQHHHVPVPDPGVFPGQLAKALADHLASVAGISPAEFTAKLTAGRHTAPATWQRRNPTADEQQAAQQLAARLHAARSHQPEPDTKPSPIPPGRLRVRRAITADAQRAAGATPTAAPWQQRATLPPPKPTLRVAVLVDTSGSMDSYAAPLSSAGWILSTAAHRNHAATVTIAFGSTATLLVPPRQRPTQVLDISPGGGTTAFADAVKLADQILDLRQRGPLRMLAVVSDGHLADIEAGQKLITTLHHSGCTVLWLQPADLSGHTFRHTTTLAVASPVEAIAQISAAAITTLENA
ncbi:VWA domain-containing protein [Micromonospora sp. NBC_01813]|uniref:VWA domain-containing protein n=1 Tax=Micromonospora sp. NBC_01813 TaxID=2975988 RepID=UPI002DDBF40D|nr:VWA domain-containing protein [Micromonospora sp. NBC_01813]WSA06982.1 VWA domain-containing protein [Micromonospora sp. NBC_01813]